MMQPEKTPMTIDSSPRAQPLQDTPQRRAILKKLRSKPSVKGAVIALIWLDITIEEDDYLADLPARVQALAEGLPVQVLRIKRQRGNAAPQLFSETMESLDTLTPHEVFARRLAQEALEPPLQQALTERYRSVVDALTAPNGDAA